MEALKEALKKLWGNARTTAPPNLVVVDDPDLRAEALSTLLYEQQTWQLRKVQSHQLQEGNYSVVRVSIDCVPQSLPGLDYALGGTDQDGQAPLIVPITYMQKGALRQFDMKGPSGESLPVIGRSEYVDLMVGVLYYQIEDALEKGLSVQVREALTVVLDADAELAERACRELLERGVWGGVKLLRPERLRGFARELLASLAKSYVLFVLLPREYAQRRVVIKYSHHAEQKLDNMSPFRRWWGAAGLERLPISFELSHPTGAASHHLEVSVPADLWCSELRMPGQHHDRNTEDSSEGGVVHAAAPYLTDPGGPAIAEFEVPWTGMRATTFLVSLTTFLILYLGVVLPGAKETLLKSADGAGALLLALPAVAVAFAAGRRESAVEAVLLGPLRYCVLSCAFWLLACAGSVVGVLHEPFWTTLWSLGAVLFGATSITLCAREGRAHYGSDWAGTVVTISGVLIALLACGIWAW